MLQYGLILGLIALVIIAVVTVVGRQTKSAMCTTANGLGASVTCVPSYALNTAGVWTRQTTATLLGGQTGTFIGVAMVGSTVHAVGSTSNPSGPLVETRSGGSWTVDSPLPSSSSSISLQAAVATADGSVWALGGDSTTGLPVAWRLSSGTWSDHSPTALPAGFTRFAFTAASATSGNHLWGTGSGAYSYAAAPGTQNSAIYSWDGTSWTARSILTTPGDAMAGNPSVTANGIYAATDSSVFVTGAYQTAAGGYPNYIDHWAGSAWSQTVLSSGGNRILTSITGSGGDVWAGGYYGNADLGAPMLHSVDSGSTYTALQAALAPSGCTRSLFYAMTTSGPTPWAVGTCYPSGLTLQYFDGSNWVGATTAGMQSQDHLAAIAVDQATSGAGVAVGASSSSPIAYDYSG